MARGSIRQRSKKRQDSWTVQVYKGRDPATGKKRYYSEAVKGTKAAAQRKLTEILHEMDTGSFVAPGGLTVGEYLDEWVEGECGGTVRPGSVRSYRMVVEQYLKPTLGGIRLHQLKPGDVRETESILLSRGGVGGKKLSSTTVNNIHMVLSSALTNAVRVGLVSTNVAKVVPPPRSVPHEVTALGWSELQSLLDEMEGDDFRSVVIVAIQTGLRRSELAGLQWRDVDLEGRVLAVRRGLVRGDTGRMLAPPKSGMARSVELPDAAVAVFESLRDRNMYCGATDFVFCNRFGRPANPEDWTHWFKAYCRKLGLNGVRFHDLRHTHASLMLAGGIHLKVVSERLGHSSIRITGDLYSHVAPTVQRDAADRFGSQWDAKLDGEWRVEVRTGS